MKEHLELLQRNLKVIPRGILGMKPGISGKRKSMMKNTWKTWQDIKKINIGI